MLLQDEVSSNSLLKLVAKHYNVAITTGEKTRPPGGAKCKSQEEFPFFRNRTIMGKEQPMHAFVFLLAAAICCHSLGAIEATTESYEDGPEGYVTIHQDGTKSRTIFDGYCYITYNPDGSRMVTYPDGMGGYVTYAPDGKRTYSYENGYGYDTVLPGNSVSESYDSGDGFTSF